MLNSSNSVILASEETLHAIVTEAVEEALRRVAPNEPVRSNVTRDLMTFAEVRLALRCSAPTLRKLLRTGKIHGSRIGDRWRFRAEDVQSFLTSRGNNA